MVNLDFLGATAQRVCLTLVEATCNGTGPWGFTLSSPVTGASVSFVSPDVSNAPGRYQEFLWQSVGPTAQDLQDGKFSFADPGTLDYSAFQLITGATDVNPSTVVMKVETGRVTLHPANVSLPSYTEDDPGTVITPTYGE